MNLYWQLPLNRHLPVFQGWTLKWRLNCITFNNLENERKPDHKFIVTSEFSQ